MQFVVVLLFVTVSVLLCLVILLQPGKGSGMGAIGGGGSSSGGSVFGARGAVGFLGKMTGWLAAAFMVLSLFLARMSLDDSAIKAPTRNVEGTTTGAGAGEEAPEAPAGEAPTAPAEAPAEAPAAPAEGGGEENTGGEGE